MQRLLAEESSACALALCAFAYSTARICYKAFHTHPTLTLVSRRFRIQTADVDQSEGCKFVGRAHARRCGATRWEGGRRSFALAVAGRGHKPCDGLAVARDGQALALRDAVEQAGQVLAPRARISSLTS